MDKLELKQKVVNSTFGWMTTGISITTIMAYLISLMQIPASTMLSLFIGCAILSFVMIFLFCKSIRDYSYNACKWIFVGFTALEGVTLSALFLAYSLPTIAVSFGITAGLFALMYFIGKTTKVDLLQYGNLFLFGLLGLIIATIINMFIASTIVHWVITYVGLVLFLGLTAYDAQKLNTEISYLTEYDENAKKVAVSNALDFYLDFINLLIYIIEIVSGNKD